MAMDTATGTSDKPFVCRVCHKSFSREKYYRRHLLIHTANKPHRRSNCGKSFKQASEQRRNLRTRTFEKPCSCQVCGKKFSRDYDLERHKNRHREKKSNTCEECGKSFALPSNFRRHMRSHTGEKPFKCYFCDKTYASNWCLKIHLLIHTGEKPHKCHICEKAFSKGEALRLHIRSHTGEKPYQCDFCGLTFSYRSNYRRHIRNHTEDVVKSHICHECGKAFVNASDLRRHFNSHSGNKPYKCEVCNKSFVYSNSINRHLRIHTGEKPFMCYICGKSFTQSAGLNQHLLVHSAKGECPFPKVDKLIMAEFGKKHAVSRYSQVRYKCDICCKTYDKFLELELHIASHTGQETDMVNESITKPPNSQASRKLANRSYVNGQIVSNHYDKVKKGDSDDAFSVSQKAKKSVNGNVIKDKYKCDSCGKTFREFSGLQSHKVCHTETKTHGDLTNVKSLKHSPDLQHPVLARDEFEVQSCGTGEKTERKPSDFRRHTMPHESERSNIPICDMHGITSIGLSGFQGPLTTRCELKERCYICSSEFKNQADLVEHMMVHTWENAPPILSML